jgi:TP901-1 family phage major tail protein
MSKNGSDLILLVNTGAPLTPVYEAVGCQRDATIDESTASIDVSCKDSRARRVLPGRYSSTISLDALYVPTNSGYQALKAAMRDGTLILVAREESEVVVETADAVITSMSETFPDQDAATISISLDVDGFWTVIGS